MPPYTTPLRDVGPDDVIPAPLSAHVSDFAGALEPSDAARAQDALLALKRDHGIDAHLVTVKSVKGIEDLDTVARRLGWVWNLDPGRGTHYLVILAVGSNVSLQGGDGFESSGQRVIDDVIGQMILVARERGVSAALAHGAVALAAQMPAHLIRDDKKDVE